jgi:hypothetical protein
VIQPMGKEILPFRISVMAQFVHAVIVAQRLLDGGVF